MFFFLDSCSRRWERGYLGNRASPGRTVPAKSMARSGFFGQPVQGELTVTRVRQYIIPVTPRDEPNVSVRRDRRSGQRFTLPPLLRPHNGTLCHFNLLPRRQLPEFSDSSYPSMATPSASPYPSNNTEHVHVSTHDHGSVSRNENFHRCCLHPLIRVYSRSVTTLS